MCHQESWTEALPLVLLGLRTAYKADIGASVAEMVYGEPLRIPSEFLSAAPLPDQTELPLLVQRIRDHVAKIRQTPATHHGSHPVFVHKALADCTHVVLRTDSARTPLQPPYTGPYQVLKRGQHTFEILQNGKNSKVSVERLKPAWVMPEPTSDDQTNSTEGHGLEETINYRSYEDTIGLEEVTPDSQVTIRHDSTPTPIVRTRAARVIKFKYPYIPGAVWE